MNKQSIKISKNLSCCWSLVQVLTEILLLNMKALFLNFIFMRVSPHFFLSVSCFEDVTESKADKNTFKEANKYIKLFIEMFIHCLSLGLNCI